MKHLLALAGVAALLAFLPAQAEDKKEENTGAAKMGCTEADMAAMTTKIDGMSSAENKKMAMDHMKMAKDSMGKSDMKGCEMHMNEAMGAMDKK